MPAERVAELEGRIEALGLMLEITMRTLVEICERVDASLPVPLASNWIEIKQAAAIANYSKPSMYRFHRQGVVDSLKQSDRVRINRDTLAACIAAHRAKRKR